MKPLNLAMTALCIGIAATALMSKAATEHTPSDYSINYYRNCELVETTPMTSAQLERYQELKALEKTMKELALPVKDIEKQAQEYGKEIERLTKLAVIEDGNKTVIHHGYMAEQQEAAEKLEALMSSHNQDFKALEAQGDKIGKAAELFEKELDKTRPHGQFDSIRVIGPGKDKESEAGCHRYADIG